MKLFRYMPVKSFEQILNTSKLNFSNPFKDWEDLYEGLIFRAIETDKGLAIVRKITKKYSNDENEAIAVYNNVKSYIRCQSWSQEGDSILMWSVYSNKCTTVMIESDTNEIKKLDVNIKKIEYIPNDFSLEDELKKVVTDKGMEISNALLSKREAFSYEKEVRLFRKPRKENPMDTSREVEIPELQKFITNVLVHPAAKDDDVKHIRELCEKNNLPFGGKSRWYDLDELNHL